MGAEVAHLVCTRNFVSSPPPLLGREGRWVGGREGGREGEGREGERARGMGGIDGLDCFQRTL